MKVVIINENSPVGPRSTPSYNLACDRIAQYHRQQGHEVVQDRIFRPMDMLGADKVYFSACFTWDLPQTVADINQAKNYCAVEVGGPAATAMPEYIKNMTGVIPVVGLDPRFENLPGRYGATFTSRGCPRACEFCLVNKLEGRKIVEYSDFTIPVGGFTGVGNNPYILDNNLIATSWGHQELVISRLKKVRNIDINSGFDCRIFAKDPEKYWNLYSQMKIECWRMAYDKEEEREPLKICADFLHTKGIDYRHIIVFCIVGTDDQTFDICQERLEYIKNLDCSQYPMRFRPLNTLTKNYTPPGWKDDDLEMLFGYYGCPPVWRKVSWKQYVAGTKYTRRTTCTSDSSSR